MKDKRKAALAAVLAALLIVWVIVKLASPAPGKTAPVHAAEGKAGRKIPDGSAIKVDLDLLKKPKADFQASKNIFDPIYRKPSLPKHSGKGKDKDSGNGNNGTVTVSPLPPLPPPPPPKSQAEIDADNAREELQKLKVLGFLKRKGKTNVFLSLGQDNFVVSKDENITKDYYLTDVAKDSVTVSDKKTGVEVKLNTDFSKEKTSTAPGTSGSGKGGGGGSGAKSGGGGGGGSPQPMMGGRQDNPVSGRPVGLPGGISVQPVVQSSAMQRTAPNPLNNFSAR